MPFANLLNCVVLWCSKEDLKLWLDSHWMALIKAKDALLKHCQGLELLKILPSLSLDSV